MKRNLLLMGFLLLVKINLSYGQDPSFSQFFSSPLNINPALTANINSDWRLIANLRDQWFGLASPYVSGTISFDSKIIQNKILNVSEKNNTMGIGGMLMYDNAMDGALKSTYASVNFSYNVKLADNEITSHRLGVGFGASYGRRYIDYNKLNFEEQYTGRGFDTNLPAGEAALSNMKPYLSVSTGIIYTMKSENSNLDIGAAAFHLNQPVQTFLKDDKQRLTRREVIHANYEMFISDRAVVNTNAVFQKQGDAKYFSVGGALGYYVDDENKTLINGGLWYWSENALIPYFGYMHKNFQLGLSYDITVSKLNQAARKPNTVELSLILRGSKEPSRVIPCPWK